MEVVDHPDAQLQPLNKWPKSQLLPNSRLRSTPRHKQVCPNLPRGQPRPLVEEVAGKVHHITQPHPLLEGLVSIVHLVIHCAQVYQAMTETRVFQKNEQLSVFLLFKKINLLWNPPYYPAALKETHTKELQLKCFKYNGCDYYFTTHFLFCSQYEFTIDYFLSICACDFVLNCLWNTNTSQNDKWIADFVAKTFIVW